MQRPTPLPAPPARTSSRSRVAVADLRRPSDRDAAGGPLVPAWLDGLDAPPTLPAAAPEEQADASAPRVTDVWRAARARRRALRAEVRRFTGRQRRRRLVVLLSAAAVVVLGLGTLGAAYSPLFAVETVTVAGTSGLDPAVVAAALSGEVGTPLPLVDASDVKAALVAFPLVESFSLEARPPHELLVRIVERTPVGVLAGSAGFTLVDAAGVALSTTPDQPAGQPLLQVPGGASGEVFAAVGLIVRSLPADIRSQVTAVAATSVDDVTLTLGGVKTQIVWGGAEDSAMKSAVLETAIRVRPLGTVSVYDVSSPAAIVIR